MTQIITERIKTFASQGIANVVWALAKFQFQQKCLLMTIAEEAPPRLDEFDPQHLSILAWAYATLEFPNRPLLSALCQAAVRKMDIFNAQHMANMTWAMATLAHKVRLGLCCSDFVPGGLPDRMSDTCKFWPPRPWSRQQGEQGSQRGERLATRSSVSACWKVASFNPQECSNLVWAFALLTFRHDPLLKAGAFCCGCRKHSSSRSKLMKWPVHGTRRRTCAWGELRHSAFAPNKSCRPLVIIASHCCFNESSLNGSTLHVEEEFAWRCSRGFHSPKLGQHSLGLQPPRIPGRKINGVSGERSRWKTPRVCRPRNS